jgi:uncharacterized membrane protein
MIKNKQFWLFLAIFFFFFLTRTVAHWNLQTDYYDQYFYDNSLWNTVHGNFLGDSINHSTYLGGHFSPLLGLWALPYFLWPTPLWVFAIQALLVTGTAILIYRFAEENLSPNEYNWMLLLLVVSVPLRYLGINDFHQDVVITFLLALALYFLLQYQRTVFASLVLLLSLLAKETAGLLIAGWGLFLLIFKKEKLLGLGLMILGLSWVMLFVKIVIPHFNPTGAYQFTNYYSQFGQSFREQVLTLVARPLYSAGYLFTGSNFLYLFLLLAPLGFLPLFAPALLMIGLFPLLANLFSNYRFQKDITTQYSAMLMPVLFYASILAVKAGALRKKWVKPTIVFFAVISVLAFMLLQLKLYLPSAKTFLAHQLLRQIPAAASVSASSHLLVHLQYRQVLALFPNINQAKYVIFEDQVNGPFSEAEYAAGINKMRQDKNYTLIKNENGISLYRWK